MIRRLTRPQTPSKLHAAGWRLYRVADGWIVWHLRGHHTRRHPAPGPAIEEALAIAEPDHERIGKNNRELWCAFRRGWRW